MIKLRQQLFGQPNSDCWWRRELVDSYCMYCTLSYQTTSSDRSTSTSASFTLLLYILYI